MDVFPPTFLDALRQRADLLELVRAHVALKKSGSSWLGLCPFHHEKTPSFNVHPEKGFFKCFGCGVGGDAIHFLMRIRGVSFPEAVEELARSVGLEVPTRKAGEGQQGPGRQELEQRYRDMTLAKQYYATQLAGPRGGVARDYLEKRGLQAATIQRFELGFAPPGWRHLVERFGSGVEVEARLEVLGLLVRKEEGGASYDRFRNRLMFPIHDERGRCVAFGGRSLGDEQPKYINSPETPLFQKGRLLFNLHQAHGPGQKAGEMLLVEGYVDVIALDQAGIGHAVAPLGTAVSEHQLLMLWKSTERIVCCFDGDGAGRKAAWRVLEMSLPLLRGNRQMVFLFLADGDDPDTLVRRQGLEGWQRVAAHPTSPADMLFDQCAAGLNLGGPEGRATCTHRLRPHLQRIEDALLRNLFAESLGQRLDLEPSWLLGERGRPMPAFQTPRPRQPVWNGPVAGRASRNYEQVMLALLLRHPELAFDFEEELGLLHLEDPHLHRLLAELLRLIGGADILSEEKPIQAIAIQQLPPSLQEVGRRILSAESETPEEPRREFQGCLLTCQLRHLQEELQELSQIIKQGIEIDNNMKRHNALRNEIARLQRQRMAVIH
ncbi:MAG: DNA primase [Magnetococcales bacterium]|nr:DNA primase [Magnetococcales bacterium]